MNAISFVRSVIFDVLSTLYQSVWFSFAVAILVMFVILDVETSNWKAVCLKWITAFKNRAAFRRTFMFVFFTVMILFRTLLNRIIWLNPLSNIWGTWGFWNKEGQLTGEMLENIVLFIPFSILLLRMMEESFWKDDIRIGRVLCIGVKNTLYISLSIEFLQLFLHVGTFQISDIFYNTLGGFLGGIIYCLIRCCGLKKKK